MAADWKAVEAKHWIETVCGPAIGAVCLGLLFKTLRVYLLGELLGWTACSFVVFASGIYTLHRVVGTVQNYEVQKAGCYVVIEALQCFFYLFSLYSEDHHSVSISIPSTILCLMYQVNLFSSKTEIVFALTKHYFIWYGVTLFSGDALFPMGLFVMVIFATLKTTEHKQAILRDLHVKNKILEEQDAMLDDLLQAIPDGVMVFTEKATVTMCNAELLRIVDIHAAELLPTFLGSLAYEPDTKEYLSKSDKLMEDILDFMQSTLPEQTFGTTKLREEYLEWRGSRCMWKDEKACILIVRNSTNWIRMQEKMKRESAYKSSLIRSVSHELRTPTNAIINLTADVVRRIDLPEDCKEDLELVSVCSQFLLSMINDLLDFSKMLAGKLTLVKTHFDVSDVLKHVYRLFVPQCRLKGLDFKLNIDPTLPKMVYSDVTRFKQVLLNLLSNAVK